MTLTKASASFAKLPDKAQTFPLPVPSHSTDVGAAVSPAQPPCMAPGIALLLAARGRTPTTLSAMLTGACCPNWPRKSSTTCASSQGNRCTVFFNRHFRRSSADMTSKPESATVVDLMKVRADHPLPYPDGTLPRRWRTYTPSPPYMVHPCQVIELPIKAPAEPDKS